MDTAIYKVDPVSIDQAIIQKGANILKKGGLVAFPTETVYGIGANALDNNAAKSIYLAKGRPSDNPLIVHVAEKEDVIHYVKEINKAAKLLMDNFWPGPLTLIFNKNKRIPDLITGGLDTVAIRMPSHKIARSLIKASGLPIAAPSANISGRPSPTMSEHVIEDLRGRVDMIIDGGSVDIGLESTVLDVTSDIPTILRPGSITKTMIEQTIGQVLIDPAIEQNNETLKPKSPGMKYRHYAPEAALIIVEGEEQKVIDTINLWTQTEQKLGKKIGVIATNQTKATYVGDHVITIGDKENTEEIARNLFRVLRDFDDLGVDIIYSESFSEENIGTAIRNRLIKASGNNVVKL